MDKQFCLQTLKVKIDECKKQIRETLDESSGHSSGSRAVARSEYKRELSLCELVWELLCSVPDSFDLDEDSQAFEGFDRLCQRRGYKKRNFKTRE